MHRHARGLGSDRRRGRGWLRRLTGFAAIIVIAWIIGLFWYAEQIPAAQPPVNRDTDTIVVLTGGSGRLAEGLRLLTDGRAKRLFVSGVYRGIDVRALLQVSRQKPDNVECCITLGYDADNTAGNARETADWLATVRGRSLRLVTANYHMPRSLLEFRRALPEVEIIAHPVFPKVFRRRNWWQWRGSAALVISEFNKYLVAAIRHELAGGRGE